MANLNVTFTKVVPSPEPAHKVPIAVGNAARSEKINIGSTSTPGTLSTLAGETVVELYAEANCWLQIGSSPVIDRDANSDGDIDGFYMASGERLHRWVSEGEKVAVIAAA